MTKQYAIDYWVDADEQNDPDRSDYSDDRALLLRIWAGQTHFDGGAFGRVELYERNGPGAGDWQLVSVLRA